MLRAPSGRRKSRGNQTKLNLVPILDAVFIFIFFLLLSASFLNLFEITSDVPIISSKPPKTKEKPLALTIIITKTRISVATGVPSKVRRSFGLNPEKADGDEQSRYELKSLRTYLIDLKKIYARENTAIFEPQINLEYEELVKIMDAVRILKPTEDPDIYYKDKDGLDRKAEALFDNIVFGNILS